MSSGKTPLGQTGRFMAFGIEFVACIVIGLFIGLGADEVLGITPFGVLTGIGLGIAAAFRSLFKMLRSLK